MKKRAKTKQQSTLDESLNIAEKMLIWISENEPAEDFREFIKKSDIGNGKFDLNLERLHEANLISGMELFMGTYHNLGIKLTYAGLKELQNIRKEKKLVKGMEINLGAVKFKIK